MKNKTILSLASALCIAAAGFAFAGETENYSSGSEKTFAQEILSAKAAALPEVSPVAAALEVPAAAEYKNLAAAFEKGTVPAKEDLAGWKAGRFIERDYPAYPGSILLASGEMQANPADAKKYRIVPFALNGTPSFFETLGADMTAGMALVIKEQLSLWTVPVFTKAEAAFERLMPSYDKGFSRYAVRKAADGRILVKNTWKSDMAGYATEGISYAYITKDITPAAQ